MAFCELVKNFDTVRGYLRDFYIYGFKTRGDFVRRGSPRSYDDERRRLESWLGEHVGSRQTPEGKNVFLSIDSRAYSHNPLYRVWGSRSFTDGDITLHFIIFDILHTPEISLTLPELTEKIDEYLSRFPEPKTPDVSTVRKKLGEYVSDGLLVAERRPGSRGSVYRRADSMPSPSGVDALDALDFFSEVSPCGVIGSFLLNRAPAHKSLFTFKHHYITSALDSEVLCRILDAMREKRSLSIVSRPPRARRELRDAVTPLRVFVSVAGGRQYLMAYEHERERIAPYRLDNIISVEPGALDPRFDERRRILDGMMCHIWGVNTAGRLEKVAFTVRCLPDEDYIRVRLLRECRCGRVTRTDDTHLRFEAEVYDARELFPFMRTFICRITELSISDKSKETTFRRDLEAMYKMYGIGEGEA